MNIIYTYSIAIILSVYQSASADVDAYMTVIADQISGPCIRHRDTFAVTPVGARIMRERNSEVSIDRHNESGTVNAAGQT